MNQKRLPARAYALVELPAVSRGKRIAFTLVELLVVIGIIALLISILLPALGAARRQAQAIKCGAALRSIGQAFQLYAIDNHGYAPPWRAGNAKAIAGQPGGIYNLYGIAYNSTSNSSNPDGSGTSEDAAFWYAFMAKYLTKSKGGSGDTTAYAQKQTQASVIWGCPAWAGYPETQSTSTGYAGNGGSGLTPGYTGYAYNSEPDMGPGFTMLTGFQGGTQYPLYMNDIRSADNFSSQNWTSGHTGATPPVKAKWFKLTEYKPAGERALCGDSYNGQLEAQPWNGGGNLPPQQPLLLKSLIDGGPPYASGGTVPGSTFDLYRHGKYPLQASAGQWFKSSGGKIAYNILYADGHVVLSNDRADSFKSMYLMYPVTGVTGARGNSAGD